MRLGNQGILLSKVIAAGGGLTITKIADWARTSGSAATPSSSFTSTNGGLLVYMGHRDAFDSLLAPTNTGTAYTWTNRNGQNNPAVGIYTAPCTNSQSMTVSIPAAGEKAWATLYEVTGQHASPIGTTGGAANVGTNNLNAAVTTTVNNSATFIVDNEYQELGAMVSSNLTSFTPLNGGSGYAGWTDGISGYRVVATAGATTINLDAGGSGTAWHTYSYCEIKPA
jgi:hypothetical protein